jgi:hypothetical protein
MLSRLQEMVGRWRWSGRAAGLKDHYPGPYRCDHRRWVAQEGATGLKLHQLRTGDQRREESSPSEVT